MEHEVVLSTNGVLMIVAQCHKTGWAGYPYFFTAETYFFELIT
jgi:hypothetical protein